MAHLCGYCRYPYKEEETARECCKDMKDKYNRIIRVISPYKSRR